MPVRASEDPITPLRQQLARVHVEEVRDRLLKALVLWEMGYPREAVSVFRITAEGALHRLVQRADPRPSPGCDPQAWLARGQNGKVIEWLYREVSQIPARVALHLHTLFGWGSYASHHQEEGHRIEPGDLAILTTIAIDLEDWLAQELEGCPSILSDHSGGEALEGAVRKAISQGVPEGAVHALLQATSGSIVTEQDRFCEPSLALELFWQRPAARALDQAPDHGLRPFDPEDADSFFGRQSSIVQLLQGVETARPVILCGESGAGKTSLLRAALLPQALQQGVKTLFLGELTAPGLVAAVQLLGAWPAGKPLLVILDQFEGALFASVPAEVRQLAVELALRASRWKGVLLVLGLREDFLGRFWRETAAVDAERAGELQKDHLLVVLDPLGPAQAGQAITGLFARSGVTLAEDLLEQHLLPDLCGQEGVAPVQLQIVCKTLIEQARAAGALRIDLGAYRALGGAREILSGHLQRVLGSRVYARSRELARAILKSLAGSEGRRWLDYGDIWQAVRRAGHPVDELALIETLMQLQADRLVISRSAASPTTVRCSLSHDVLVSEVRGWRAANELERERAQELLDQAIRTRRDACGGEPLIGRNLQLVERNWELLDLNEGARAVLQTSRRLRLAKRLALLSLVVVAAVGVTFGAVQFRNALQEQARAKEAADLGVLLSVRLAMQHDPSLAVAWLRHLSLRGQGLAVRSLLDEARRRGVAHVFGGHSALVTSVDFSRDGQTLLSASRDGTVRFWSLSSTRSDKPPLLGHKGYVTRAIFSPDGALFATSSWDKTVRIWQARSGAQIGPPLRHESWVYDIAFSPDGSLLAAVGLDGAVHLWSVQASRRVGSIPASDQALLSVSFTADGKAIIAAGLDGVVRIWDVASRSLQRALAGHTGGVYAVQATPDAETIISASLDSTIRLWSAATGEVSDILRGHTDGVIALALSPDGRVLASGGEDKLILLWDLPSRTLRDLPLRGHMGFIAALAFSADGKTLVSASQDQTIRLWHLPSRQAKTAERHLAHDSWVQALAFAPRGELIASGTRQGVVQLWEVQSGQPASAAIKAHEEAVVDLAFTADGRALLSGARDGTLRLWPFRETKAPLPAVATPQEGGMQALALGREDVLYTGGGDGTILRWRLSGGGQLRREKGPLIAHNKAVLALCESPDGKLLASASRDRAVQLWDPATLQPRGSALLGHKQAIHDLSFSPEGDRLASASADGTVRIWQLDRAPASATVLSGHQHWVLSLAFAPGGQILASGGSDSTVRLWDVAQGRPLEAPFFGHADWVYSVAFSPDGKVLASGSGDKAARLVPVNPVGQQPISAEIDALTNLHVEMDGKTWLD